MLQFPSLKFDGSPVPGASACRMIANAEPVLRAFHNSASVGVSFAAVAADTSNETAKNTVGARRLDIRGLVIMCRHPAACVVLMIN